MCISDCPCSHPQGECREQRGWGPNRLGFQGSTRFPHCSRYSFFTYGAGEK